MMFIVNSFLTKPTSSNKPFATLLLAAGKGVKTSAATIS